MGLTAALAGLAGCSAILGDGGDPPGVDGGIECTIDVGSPLLEGEGASVGVVLPALADGGLESAPRLAALLGCPNGTILETDSEALELEELSSGEVAIGYQIRVGFDPRDSGRETAELVARAGGEVLAKADVEIAFLPELIVETGAVMPAESGLYSVIAILGDATLTSAGKVPFELRSSSAVVVLGTIDVSASGGEAGPGGFPGGLPGEPGDGPGGGPGATNELRCEGGGGGFGTQGGNADLGAMSFPGGAPYGAAHLLDTVAGRGGSGGGGCIRSGDPSGGGSGGGHVEVVARGAIAGGALDPGAIRVDGQSGEDIGDSSGGGGAGGAIFLRAARYRGHLIASAVGGESVNGGNGGDGRIRIDGVERPALDCAAAGVCIEGPGAHYGGPMLELESPVTGADVALALVAGPGATELHALTVDGDIAEVVAPDVGTATVPLPVGRSSICLTMAEQPDGLDDTETTQWERRAAHCVEVIRVD